MQVSEGAALPAFPVIDTHAHLCDSDFDVDRHDVLERARAVGVVGILCVGETLADAERNLALCKQYNGDLRFPELRMAAGVHPTKYADAREVDDVCAFIRRQARAGTIHAIGEVGLDHWVVKEEPQRVAQREVFHRFVDLAIELDLPLNVHSRSAGRVTVETLLQRGARKVQMHGFDARAASALDAVEAGYYFSVPASIGRSPQKQKLVGRLPLSCIVLETDSPVLGPDAALRNEPANVVIARIAVSELKRVSEADVTRHAIENTRRLYDRGDEVWAASLAPC